MVKEIVIGAAGGIMAFLYLQGYNVLPILLIAGLLAGIYFTGGFRPANKSFAVVGQTRQGQPDIKFDDIGGQEVAKNELREALEFILNAETVKTLGIRPLKGILLSGPPGTGKTLLAKAAAHFTDSVFVAASGSEFVEMYVGVGAQRVRQLFKQARELAVKEGKQSAVIFIDEIEVLGGKRGQHAGHMEYDQTLNQLLVEMDGITAEDGVRILVIGATNRMDMLDPALLRPGRFDRQVRVDLPDKAGRLHILRLHTRGKPLDADIDLEAIAQETFGFSGAHLESLVNEAAIFAFREKALAIQQRHLRAAIDKVILGEKLDRTPSQEEKYRIAVHETGHALMSEKVRPGSVSSVTITSRGKALGYMRQNHGEDMYLHTAEYIRGQIAVLVAGALAEEVLLGSRSSGAGNDFQEAAKLAKHMIYGGMSPLGVVSPDDLPRPLLHETLTALIRKEEQQVRSILTALRQPLAEIAAALMEREVIGGDELRQKIAVYFHEQCA